MGTMHLELGQLLRRWRRQRHLTQLDLALAADISTKHISFLETGRSEPSRAIILRLCHILSIPLQDRNILLQAGGFAPAYQKSALDTPQMLQVKQALHYILKHHEPFPAIVIDPGANVIMANGGYMKTVMWLAGATDDNCPTSSYEDNLAIGSNAIVPLFDPDALRSNVSNFSELAPVILRRVYEESLYHPSARELFFRLLKFPECESLWKEASDVPQTIVPVVLNDQLSLISTITSLGTAQDITAKEIHIETFFPADQSTENFYARN